MQPPSAIEYIANLAADPEVAEVVIGRVTRHIGDVKLPDPEIPGFNLFSYWAIEVEEYLLGGIPFGEVVVVINEGDSTEEGVKFRGARFPITMTPGDEAVVFLRHLPPGWPPLGGAAYAIPASPDINGMLPWSGASVEITRNGQSAQVSLNDFVTDVIRAGELVGKATGRVIPPPIATPAPISSELIAAGSLRTAIYSLPEEARLDLGSDVVAVIPGLSGLDRMPAELDPIDGTAFGICHLPTGSWTWFYQRNDSGGEIVGGGKTYKTLAAIEAIESVIRDPEVIADLIDRVPVR